MTAASSRSRAVSSSPASSSSSSSSSSAVKSRDARRSVVRFVLSGDLQCSGPAVFSTAAADGKGGGEQDEEEEEQKEGGKGSEGKGSTISSSSSPAQSSPQSVRGRGATGAAQSRKRSSRASAGGAASPSSSSSSSSAAAAASSSSTSASPSTSFFHRSVLPHPDVVPVPVEDTPLLLASAVDGQPASQNGSQLHINGSLALVGTLGLSGASLSSSSSSLSSSSVPSLSSQLMGSMLNISQPDVSMPIDVNQFPYSGPVLSSARLKPSFPVIIPAAAQWFDLDVIHDRERKAFPDWLEGKEGRQQSMTSWYRTVRNSIVTTYRANPRVYLTITACRRSIAADVGAVTRVHHFLQQSGLINYHVDPGSQPLMGYTSKEKITYPILAHSTNTTHAHGAGAASATDSALSQLYAFPSAAPSTSSSSAPSTSSSTSSPSSLSSHPLPPSFRRLLVGPVLSQDTAATDPRYGLAHGSSVACHHCGSREAVEGVRFTARHDPSIVLCPDCYGNGRLPLLTVQDDFVRSDTSSSSSSRHGHQQPPSLTSTVPSSSSSSSDWTAEETLRLLDALAQHGEEWDAVAEHVGGGKTKDDCCLHFLSLPIEDPFLDQYPQVVANGVKGHKGTPGAATEAATAMTGEKDGSDGDVDMTPPATAAAALSASSSSLPLSTFPLPFADAGNPILAQVAFLASTVSPAVAAAAAQAAIHYYTTQHDTTQQQAAEGEQHNTAPSPQCEVKPFGVGVLLMPSTGAPTDEGMVKVRLPWGDLYTQRTNVHGNTSSFSPSSLSSLSSSSTTPSPSLPSFPSPSSSVSSSPRVTDPVPLSSVPLVSSICLSAAAVKAKELSLDEERKALRCVAQLVQAQMRRVELKLNHLNDLDLYVNNKQHELHQHFTSLYHTTQQQPHTATPQQTASPPQPDAPAAVDSTPAADSSTPHNNNSNSTTSSSAMQISA